MKTREVEVLKDVTCDRCATTRTPEGASWPKDNPECVVIAVDWGYGTPWDGERHRGFLCVVCYQWLLDAGFKPAGMEEYK